MKLKTTLLLDTRGSRGVPSAVEQGGNKMGGNVWAPNEVEDSGVYIWCGYEELIPVADDRVLTGNFTLPAFKSVPTVSAQIVTSVGSALVVIYAAKIEESGDPLITNIVVEAETIANISPLGSYYLNIIVTGVPVDPPPPRAS
jgi:hypothetical protein